LNQLGVAFLEALILQRSMDGSRPRLLDFLSKQEPDFHDRFSASELPQKEHQACHFLRHSRGAAKKGPTFRLIRKPARARAPDPAPSFRFSIQVQL
jgi:hypothetical protein